MDKKFNTARYAEDFSINSVEKIRINRALDFIGTNKTVLDVGCGDGFISELIKNRGNTVSGIELSDPAIKKAREKGFTVYDIDLNSDWSTNIKDKFDIVFAAEIIEHIFDTDRFLQNIRSVLKENGTLVLTTPNIASLGRRLFLLLGKNPLIETTARNYDAGHIRYFTFASLRILLEENQFQVTNRSSDCVNFDIEGRIKSKLISDLFPSLGRSIIIQAQRR